MWLMHKINTADRLLGLLLLFAIICLCPHDTTASRAINSNTQCAAFGEYCQNHFDCCSNSCLSYMYRCTRGYQNIYPFPFLSPQYEQPGYTSYADILGINFGYEEAAPAATFGVELLPARRARAVKEQVVVVGIEESSSESAAAKATQLYEVVTKAAATSAVSGNIKTDGDVQEANVEPDTDSDSRGQCKEIGLKCFRNEECCTRRCHGYLHQCVT